MERLRLERERFELWERRRKFGYEVLIPQRKQVLGLTQEKMEQRTGLDRTRISRIEKGDRPKDLITANKLAEEYRLDEQQTSEWIDLFLGGPIPQHNPRFITYPPRSIEFNNEISIVESQEGELLLIKDCFSERVPPPWILAEQAQLYFRWGGEKTDYISSVIATRRERSLNFRKQIKKHPCREIYSKRAIEQYVESGVPSQDDVLVVRGLVPDTPWLRSQHLKAIVDLLVYEVNYEVALVGKRHEHLLPPAFYAIKGYENLLVEAPPNNRQAVWQNFRITEPITVDMYRNRFLKIWSALNTDNKDKRHVIAYLQQQVVKAEQKS